MKIAATLTLALAVAACASIVPSSPSTLTVAPESDAPYDRSDWSHWTVEAGCSTREEILIASGADVLEGPECEPITGRWHSPYDNRTLTDPSALDIDHIVALSEANDSGAAHWSPDRRTDFANDPRNLLAVSASSNRSKSSDDPADWLPPNESFRCEFLRRYVDVKRAYGLAVDTRERAAIRNALRTC